MRIRASLALTLLVLLAGGAPSHAARNGDVASLQVALGGVGLYGGTIDGVAGPSTDAAVRSFQGRHGIAVDGVAGAATRRALGGRGRPAFGSRAMHSGNSGWDVAGLQFRLAWHGFPSGSIDGGFGSHTQAAVSRFQAWAGLTPDGVAGPATVAALRRPVARSPIWVVHPVRGRISDRFGPRGSRFHTGVGRWVAAGSRVGLVGATGIASGPHLHFELRLRGAAIDPLTALR